MAWKSIGYYKDQIDVCKDCEFRHIRTDCRIRRNDNIYSKPTLKCGYSPYTNEWEDWSTQSIETKKALHTEVQELVKKREFLKVSHYKQVDSKDGPTLFKNHSYIGKP
jgi:hypothetical protein